MKDIRPFGWVIISINALIIINFFYGISGVDDDTVIGLAFIFNLFLLAIINVPLYIIYRITDKKKRECPACGSKVPVGLTVCETCLHDFRK
jgi:hypothetical protein